MLSESNPKARKEHVCIWCGEKILIGEKYHRESGAYDGQLQDSKWHLECNLDALEFFRTSHEYEFQVGENERPKERLGFA
jgi:hypothetical protein